MIELYKFYENGPIIIEPKIYQDNRGYFFESFNDKEFNEKSGLNINFVQDNQSLSCYGTLRGLHFQLGDSAQAKLVRVVKGAVLDVAVNIDNNSPHFGEINVVYLSDKNFKQFFIPRNFAHGFLTLQDDTIFQYKCDNYYDASNECGINAFSTFKNGVRIPWETHVRKENIIMSEKDKLNKYFYE